MLPIQSRIATGEGPARAAHGNSAWKVVAVALGCIAAAPAVAENWRFSASAGATETYTSNANYSSQSQATGDFATSLTASLGVNGEGARVSLNGNIGVTGTWYGKETQNNSIAPNVNLAGHLEAIEKFAFIDASANVSQTFASPFGPQPANLVNATANRYTQQSYTLSPYIKGVLGSTNISYQVRDDNYWSVASSYGNASTGVPTTYTNNFVASMRSGTNPVGWTLEYHRIYYDSGLEVANDVGALNNVNPAQYTVQIARAIVSHQVDPQVALSARIGYEDVDFPVTGSRGPVYGGGIQWDPTARTHVGGFWEQRFFGSSFSWQITHRLPNAAISANFTRGLNTPTQRALSIPAGASVAQYLDAAFTTRIPDPAERAQAVADFLARTGLPPTLVSPVNFYGYSIVLQNAQNVSLVLTGVRNSVTFTVFNLASDAISGKGNELPPALQFGQNNTQTGVGVGYSHQLGRQTTVSANASYSRTVTNQTSLSDVRSENWNAGLTLTSQLGPKTTVFASAAYSLFTPTGGSVVANANNTSTVNASIGITHRFW